MVGFPDSGYSYIAPEPPNGYEETYEGDGKIIQACGKADGVYVNYNRFATNTQGRTMYLQVRFTEYGGTGTWKSYDNYEVPSGYGCSGSFGTYYSGQNPHFADEVLAWQLTAIAVMGLIFWGIAKLILGRLLRK